MVVAKRQTSGRGKPGSLWYSPEGGLYFSLILKPRKNIKDLAPMTLLAAQAVVSAIQKECGLSADVKLPNDVLIGSKKVCGILTEKTKGSLIIGIGLNLNIKNFPEELAATSLFLECKKTFNPKSFLDEILAELKKKYFNLLHNGL